MHIYDRPASAAEAAPSLLLARLICHRGAILSALNSWSVYHHPHRRSCPLPAAAAAPQVYPLPTPSIEDDEEGLLPTRLTLHRLLGLPTNRPLLRVANALDFDTNSGSGSSSSNATSAGGSAAGGVGGRPRLADVHMGLAASGVGGSVHIIQGTYDYYHYMQARALAV